MFMYVGGDFVADFSKVGEVYQYSDEYGRIVQISYMTSIRQSDDFALLVS